ncbi:MAG: MutH/Sau3AI family endonuclease [Candidatus Porifericomitaceae bacterium WSBS_2022_MAG_OTU9]
MIRPLPPASEQLLLQRAMLLAGRSIAEVAASLAWTPPSSSRLDCGWSGRLMEAVLGASAGSRPEPDFPGLGLELKTVPVGVTGKPRTPSFLCTVQLPLPQPAWEYSLPYRKLARMLWLPIVGKKGQAPGSRRIGTACLFSPTPEQWRVLHGDWSDIMEYLHLQGTVPPQCGKWLCVRPSQRPKVLHFCLRPALTSQIVNAVAMTGACS